jgi:hypothetical protein
LHVFATSPSQPGAPGLQTPVLQVPLPASQYSLAAHVVVTDCAVPSALHAITSFPLHANEPGTQISPRHAPSVHTPEVAAQSVTSSPSPSA